VRWRFEQFLGFTGYDWTELRVRSFEVQGRNKTSKPLLNIDGYIRSEISNEEVPLTLIVDGDPVRPDATYAIPASATFVIACMIEGKSRHDQRREMGMSADHFLHTFGGLVFTFQANGREWTYISLMMKWPEPSENIEPNTWRDRKNLRRSCGCGLVLVKPESFGAEGF
jgi:hypothetical protein